MTNKLMILIVILMIFLFITINLWHYIPKEKTIEVRDRIIIEKEKCILNCTEANNQINCMLPENRTLNIIERTRYEMFIR